MNKLIRFGRKISMPSTAEIKHELRLMAASDAVSATKARLAEASQVPLQDIPVHPIPSAA